MKKPVAQGYSSESTQGELSYEYQYDKTYSCALDKSSLGIGSKSCLRNTNMTRLTLVLWTKVALALEGLTVHAKLKWKS